MTQIRTITNPAAFGAEWTTDYATYQLVNLRGTTSLLFGMKGESGRWHNTPVVDPERFGMRSAPRNVKEFLAIARAYVEA